MKDTMKPLTYDQKLFTLPGNSTDYDVKSEQSDLFKNVPNASHVVLFFDKEVKVRFNTEVMPLAILPISRSPFQSPTGFLEIKNLFLTEANGDDVEVEVWLW